MEKKKNIALLIISLLIIAGAAVMGFRFKQTVEVSQTGQPQAESSVPNKEPPLESTGDSQAVTEKTEIFSGYMEQASQKLSTMTLEERVGQVFLARYLSLIHI